MKKTLLLMALLASLLTSLLSSCGTDSRHFRIEGRLLHLNQGEFYVYSPDAALPGGIDTIKVQAGRFSYDVPCDHPMTLMIVFPNFTEQPVFAQPGKSVDIKGDASHLKEMTVKGTKDNELMNKFREQTASASPVETRDRARQFIEDHPESAVSVWLVARQFIAAPSPDTKTAAHLIDLMIKSQPENGTLKRLRDKALKTVVMAKGSAVPNVLGTTLDGKSIGRAQLTKAPVTVVLSWASWKYESTSLLRRVSSYASGTSGRVAVVGVSVDASPEIARTGYLNPEPSLTLVCDGKMVESPFFAGLGLFSLPDNIVIRGGRVAAAHLTDDQLMEEIKK